MNGECKPVKVWVETGDRLEPRRRVNVCSECGHQIGWFAKTCPQCGRRIEGR